MIYCFMRSGAVLPSHVCDALMHHARAMYRDSTEVRTIKHSEFEGSVSTRGEGASLGSISGQMFHAEIHFEGGSTKIDFVVRMVDLNKDAGWFYYSDKGKWEPFDDSAWN